MAVTFQLPTDLEDELRGQLRDLDAVAKEALLVSLYRQGKLSHASLAKALGLDRVGAEDVLRKHGVNDQPANAGERIRKTPGVVGGDARVRDTRIPVWTLVELRKQGRTDEQLVEDFPGLTRDDLHAAWDYYRRHAAEIDEAIAAEARED